MKGIGAWTLFIAIFLCSRSAWSQGLPPLPPGGYYISCPYGLNNIAFDYTLLEYKGHYWDTSWRASTAAFPLPPRAWYVPVGTNTLVSIDGKARWTDVQVEIVCWIYNGLDILTRHYDPVRFGGTVTECTTTSGGGNLGGTGFTDVGMDPGYDPYGTSGSGGSSCGSSSSPDSGGGIVCHTEYIYIDISFDGGITWETWWEGNATVCA